MFNDYICAIDIGSSKIAATVGKIRRKRIVRFFFESVSTKGIQRGAVVDALDLAECLNRLIKNLKIKSGINIKSIYADISCADIVTRHSYAAIALAEKGHKVITAADIQKVNLHARILANNLQEEVIHAIPLTYNVDSKNNILNPLGLYSHKLEVDLYLVCVRLSVLENLAQVINQAGCEIKKIFFSGLTTSRIVFNQQNLKSTDIFCDMGAGITELLIFKDARLRDLEILNLGGNDLTAELSDTLKIPFATAEEIKRSQGIIGSPERIPEDKEILIRKDNVYRPIKQKLVCEILTSKASSICRTIKEVIDKRADSMQIDNFITCGEAILAQGFLEMLETTLGIPVKLARIKEPRIAYWVNKEDALSGQKYLTYITSLGILCQALSGDSGQDGLKDSLPQNFIRKTIDRVKEIYQEYF